MALTAKCLVPALLISCSALSLRASAATPLVFETLSGPITPGEIAGFESWMEKFEPDATNENDAWAFGHSGQALEALGYLYEATHEQRFLDRMIAIASTGLAERNDLAPAPVGHRPLWPGVDTPAWGNQPAEQSNSSHAGPESADVAGRIARAAVLILKAPALSEQIVPDTDPFHFGKTYGERARTFVRLLDMTAEQFVVPYFVKTSDHNRFFYPRDHRYTDSLSGAQNNAGSPIPWNQQLMIDNLFQRLAECHELLGDKPDRVAFYDACVATSLAWFLGSTNSHSDSRAHGVYYTWSYAIDDAKHVEDGAHAGLDLEGLYRAYLSNRYQSVLGRSQMQAFANDVVDVMPESQGHWAGTVDGGGKGGHAAVTDYPRPNIILMLEFRPEAFPYFAKAALSAKRTVGDPTAISHLLWAKYRISENKGS